MKTCTCLLADSKNVWVYLSVTTCDIFIFVLLVSAGVSLLFNGLLALRFSVSFVMREFNGFFHRRLAKSFPSNDAIFVMPWRNSEKSRVLIGKVNCICSTFEQPETSLGRARSIND